MFNSSSGKSSFFNQKEKRIGFLSNLKAVEKGQVNNMTDLIKFQEFKDKIKNGALPTSFNIPQLQFIIENNHNQINSNWIANAVQVLHAMEDSEDEKNNL